MTRLLDFKPMRLRSRDWLKLLIDVFLMGLAALWAWYNNFGQSAVIASPLGFVLVVIGIRLPLYFFLRLHRSFWSQTSRWDLSRVAFSALAAAPAIVVLSLLLPAPFTVTGLRRPYLLFLIEPALYAVLFFTVRLAARAMADGVQNVGQRTRLLIVGAGKAGAGLALQAREITHDYQVVGFVDDNPRRQGRVIQGVPVLGRIADTAAIVHRLSIQEIIVALPEYEPEILHHVLAVCDMEHIPIRILPPLKELVNGHADLTAVRGVRMEDLMPRAEIELDIKAVTSYLAGQVVLVTGGGGSIGSELCRQVLHAGASHLLILGRGENSVFETWQELSEEGYASRLTPVICDTRDRPALKEVFDKYKPQVVFHAAAHKHVPLMEKHPAEAVKNNITGTMNAASLSAETGVRRFVLVSTDKAVNPSSVMGVSKLLAEKIVRSIAAAGGTDMVSVRFGNVLGSRGSVVRIMTRQIEKRRPVTITDPEMVRYFMTIPEAVNLILQAGALGGQGEVYVFNMGKPVRIIDLACDLIRLSGLIPYRDIPISFTGPRPGEKVVEELFTEAEKRRMKVQGSLYVAPPDSLDPARLWELVASLEKAAQEQNESLLRDLLCQAAAYCSLASGAAAKIALQEVPFAAAK